MLPPSVLMRNSLLLIFALWAGWPIALAAPDKKPGIVWHARTSRMDAGMENWTLPQALGRLARVTGWQVGDGGVTARTADGDLELGRSPAGRLLSSLAPAEHDVDALAQLREQPIASGMHHFERGQV